MIAFHWTLLIMFLSVVSTVFYWLGGRHSGEIPTPAVFIACMLVYGLAILIVMPKRPR
jgi:hypothetical protein